MKLPAEYSAAKNALAKITHIIDVKSERAKAISMEVWAYQAKDADLLAKATTVRKWSERRIGELMEGQRKAGALAKGGAEKGVGRRGMRVIEKPAFPTLAAQGVDKNLADRSRKAFAMSEAKFAISLAKTIKIAIAAVEHTTEVIRAAREERHAEKKKKRETRERAMGEAQLALPDERFGVILADPEWRFEFFSEKGKTNSSADNHYRTSALEVIKSRNVLSIAADDCVLFLWATVPLMPEALEVMETWGFEYKSSATWVKDRAGTGYWFRNRHEILLLGTRGKPPCPAEGEQWESVIEAPVGKHSEKPEAVREMIEQYFPTMPKIELNQRTRRNGWKGWGDEAPVAQAAE